MSNNKPTLIAHTVKNRGRGQKAIWTRIGAAWPHSSGIGLSIELEAFPVDGRLVLVPPLEKQPTEGEPEADPEDRSAM
jgi:hypothetical protein